MQTGIDPPIFCTTFTVSLADNPLYKALSYTWGDASITKAIVVDGQVVQVTENLESALRHLRQDGESLILWIDAISINQFDDDEKGWQVGQMQDVYRKADRVIVWLGPAANDSDLAMNAIRRVGGEAFKLRGMSVKEVATKGLRSRLLDLNGLDEGSAEQFYHRIAGKGGSEWHFPLAAMAALAHRPWWRRVWVLQEFVFAKHLLFVCGLESVEGRHFMGAWGAVELLRETIPIVQFNELQPISEYEHNFVETMLDDPARTMIACRRSMSTIYKSFRPHSLMGLLHQTTRSRTARQLVPSFAATDPRDRIFGLLGLASDRAELNITPDYRKTCCEVYIAATIGILSKGFVNLLCSTSSSQSNLRQVYLRELDFACFNCL